MSNLNIKPIGATPNNHTLGINGFNGIDINAGTPIYATTTLPSNSLGTIVYDDFNRTTLGSNWSTANIGGSTAAIVSNALNLSGGTNLNTEYITYSAYTTSLEKWTLTCPFKCTEKSATSQGFMLGIRGKTNAGAGQRTMVVHISLTTGANGGKTFLYSQTGASAVVLQSTASSAVAFVVNDEMQLTITRNKFTVTIIIANLTTPASVTHTYTYPTTDPQTSFMHATGNIGIYIKQGTQTIRSITMTSNETVNPNALLLSASIGHGIYATSISSRYMDQTMQFSNKVYSVLAGPGDDTGNMIARVNEMLSLRAKYILAEIGVNDLSFGVANATWQANYRSIRDQLVNNGSKFIHLLPTPQNALDVTPLVNWIQLEYGSRDIIIDDFHPMLGSGTTLNAAYAAADNAHLNAAGHAYRGKIIYTALANINIL